MAKAREKIPQLGFWDTEVPKPDHDDVCRWAYENVDMIFRTVCPERFDKPWLQDEVSLGWNDRDEYAKERSGEAKKFADTNQRPNPRVTTKTWEFVLTRRTGYQDRHEQIVGYADLMIETELPCIFPKYKVWEGKDVFDGFAMGFTPRLSSMRPYIEAPRILVEAKSVLPSFGELMRQINLYRTAFNGLFVVVAPDDSYAEILSEQGVAFVKYAP